MAENEFKKEENNQNNWTKAKAFYNTICLANIAGLIINISSVIIRNYIPSDDNIQFGYVKPSYLEIKLEDLDNNGKNEVLLKYGNRDYLLILDEKGKPKVQDYQIKPSEIIPINCE
ncbi:MAG: hypothetical protein ACOYT4_05430 [Nanoarchaeota archaeon]